MVQLSIDPPPFSFGNRPSGGGLARFLVYPIILVVGLAGGFVIGRKTAPREPASAANAPHPAAPAPARTAPPPVAAAPAPPGAQPAPAAPPQPMGAMAAIPDPAPAAGTAAPPPASATPPGAPQGPLVRRIAVVLKGPLEDSIQTALPANEKSWAGQLGQVVNRLLVWSMQVSRDGRKGDRLEVLYELPSAVPSEVQFIGESGPSTKEPVVLALRYGSQKLGKLLTAYRFKAEGAPFARYYTSEGVEVEEHLVDSPVDVYEQITSLLRDGRRHKGVDYKTPVGTPVKAPFDGQITRRNWHFSANGNCLELLDGKTGRKAIFLHLEAAPKEMQPGAHVAKGQIVAKSGNSGHSTAPHLHYQLEAPGGKVLDPFAVLPTKQVKLEGAARSAFDQERGRLEPMLVANR
jgi:murein DD-endopeptidase